MNQDLTFVAGGTGKTGRRVAARLKDRGIPFHIGSRTGTPPFNWEDRETWAPCLKGITRAYVTHYPDLCVPGAVEVVRSFFDCAISAGVRRLVLLSGRGEVEAQRAEEALKASGAEWTVLRCSFFAQNFSEGMFADALIAGELALPVGAVREPFIDLEDIADVAADALCDLRHSGQLYELTGPRSITFAEAVKEIGHATNRDIRYITNTPEEYRAGMRQAQMPEDVIDLVLYLFGTVLDGRNAGTADGVQRALRRPARDFREYVHRTAASGVWR